MFQRIVGFKAWVTQKQGIISVLAISITLAWFSIPLFKNIDLPVDNSDYYRVYYRLGVLRKIFLEYRQFPMRNPFLSGGYPILGDPYIFTLNPLYIFALLFGEVAGIKLAIFSLLLFSALGMFYLTRYVLNYNCIGSIFSTLIFMLNSWGVYQITDGNYQNIYYYLLPWLLAFSIKAKNDRKFTILAGLILGLVLVEGGLITVPVLIFLLIYACLQIKISFAEKRLMDFSYLKIFFPILIFACLFSAIKLIPAIDLLRMRSASHIHFIGEHSYAISSYLSRLKGNAFNIMSLSRALLDNSYVGLGQMYIGIIPYVFFILSSTIFIKENLSYLLILLLFIALSFGSNSPIDLFKLIWHIHPFMHGIWKLNKYFAFFIFFLISLIAGRLFLFSDKIKKLKIPIKVIFIALAVIGVTNMFNANRKSFRFSYIEYPKIKKVNYFFSVEVKKYIVTGPFDDVISDEKVTRFYWLSMLQGFGVINNILGGNFTPIKENIIPKYFIDNKYYDELKHSNYGNPMENQKINSSYKGELFFLKEDNYASLNYFSPNKLEAYVHVNSAPDILIINQRYDTGWRCNVGRLQNWHGLLGIKLENHGSYLFKLKYRPGWFFLSLSISFISLILAYVYWTRCGLS